ncbi:hypothetical protein O6H91_17G085800 [Diphasiastrum complanatum]|uniref:Uncharacterized protein n=1 Tax=Diphasiastrum complanatum TaxID=34168 RepID=A0ACC2B9S9_DIPCM|nr:hypothetical protein O6H91_17G085800 [Diphasiastrum complanatum]
MWNTLATFRENLSQIASEVLDTAEELEIGGLQEATSASHDDDESPHTRFKRYSTLMHNKANGQSEEATESVEKILRHHTSGLPLLPKSYSSDLQLKWNHGSSDVDGKLTENRSGISSDFGTRPQDLEYKVATLQEREKDLFSQVSAKEQAYRILKEEQDTVLAELERVKQALSSERLDLSEKNLQLQRQNEALQAAVKECNLLKDEKDRMCVELADLHRREDEEVASRDCTIDQMQADFQSRADEQVAAKDAKLAELQRAVTELQEEKCALQAEREKLREDLQSLQQGTPVERVLENEQCDVNSAELERLDLRSEVKQVDTLSNRLKMAEEELALEKLQHQKRLDAVSMERDKAIRDLSRLKQHLLDKELADSEKMDHDSEQIQELEARAATSSARVLQLEQSLSLALANQAESNKRSADELRRAREEVESLNQKLSNVLLALDSKDVELANLQSALGQYYAESEAQERLHGELRSSKEEIARLLDNLRVSACQF